MKDDEIYRMLDDATPRPSSGSPGIEPLDEPSGEILERASTPVHLGEIPSPDGYAVEQGDCGDAMEVYLSVNDRTIRTARFDTLGCGYTVACGDVAMEMAENRSLAEALGIRPEQIEAALGGLPASHKHCAQLAVRALRSAIRTALERARDPWKKQYG